MLKTVAVYCGSSVGNDPIYARAAVDLADQMLLRGIGLVYGGGNVGLMGEIANTMIAGHGSVIGVIPEFLMRAEVGFTNGIDQRIVPDMHTRKAAIAGLADGFIAMPGGLGTLEEIAEALTWAQLGLHRKPCAFYNVNGYYDHLLAFLENAVDSGFIHPINRSLFLVAADPSQLLDQMVAYQPPVTDKAAFARHMTNQHPKNAGES
jgi:hypothetical protein